MLIQLCVAVDLFSTVNIHQFQLCDAICHEFKNQLTIDAISELLKQANEIEGCIMTMKHKSDANELYINSIRFMSNLDKMEAFRLLYDYQLPILPSMANDCFNTATKSTLRDFMSSFVGYTLFNFKDWLISTNRDFNWFMEWLLHNGVDIDMINANSAIVEALDEYNKMEMEMIRKKRAFNRKQRQRQLDNKS